MVRQRVESLAAMKIIICHIHEDTSIAQILQDWIESTFAGQSDVFVHSDDEIILSDAAWLEKMDDALEGANALILVISPTSIQKPWLNFELGCAWMKGIFILPICHSGITIANLPQPLSMFQGLDLNQENFPEMLFTLLGKQLGIRKLPHLNFAEMAGEIRKAQEAIRPRASEKAELAGETRKPQEAVQPRASEEAELAGETRKPQEAVQPRPSKREEIPQPVIQEERRLAQTHEQILVVLAKADTVGFTAAVLADHFKMQEPKVKVYLKKLTEDKYVYAGYPGSGQRRYKLTLQGKAYLEEYGLI